MPTSRNTESQRRRLKLHLGKEKRGQQKITQSGDTLKGNRGKKKIVSVETGWAVSNETEECSKKPTRLGNEKITDDSM